ncbi:uncharacterized protein LOC133188518 [Saccostrea echinata]|uniref:uncharacterized protein LOC133188518 n=1 Tax=Saccostrea echinata TaxID=191078 RepID=UPI002A81AE12|nr:uncharacterized protein LOC133188518 [Saccostrea echinata]
MDPSVVESLQALERTAAWVNQVAQMRQMTNFQDMKEDSTGDSNPDRDACSDKDYDDIPDSYEGFQTMEPFGSSDSSRQADAGSSSTMDFVDIPATVQEFKASLESSGISQRFAAKFIMESTSQGNLSFLLEKGKSKHWSELSGRGRLPYIRMRRWLDSPEEQRITLNQLSMTKEFKKTGPKDGSGRRGKFTLFQLMVLCRFFEEDQNPSLNTRMLLAEKLLVSLERITIWFQNQRARGFPAKRVLCLMSVDRQNAESEKAEFGRKYKNIQDDIQKRTQALTGALQTMGGQSPDIPNSVNRINDALNTSSVNGMTEHPQSIPGPVSNKDLLGPGSIRSLPASLPMNQRFKPYDMPPGWRGGERYSNFTNYLLHQSSSSVNSNVHIADPYQQSPSNASIKKEIGEMGNSMSSGTCSSEKEMINSDPRPTFLVQNMVNSTVFSRPSTQGAYPLQKNGVNNTVEKKDTQIPSSAVQKMSEMVETASDYSKHRGGNSNFLNCQNKSDELESLKWSVKVEPGSEVTDDSLAMSSKYKASTLQQGGTNLILGGSDVTDHVMDLVYVKTENVENGDVRDMGSTPVKTNQLGCPGGNVICGLTQ